MLIKPIQTIHSIMPTKHEIKDEHIWMAGAYGFGSFLMHTHLGSLMIALAYLLVFTFNVHEMRKA